MKIRQWGTRAILASLGVTVGFMIFAARPWTESESQAASSGLVSLGLLCGWAASPYVGALLIVRRVAQRGRGGLMETALLVAVCLLGPALVAAAASGMGGAQSGMGFLFLPLLQWAGLGAVALVFAFVWRKRGE